MGQNLDSNFWPLLSGSAADSVSWSRGTTEEWRPCACSARLPLTTRQQQKSEKFWTPFLRNSIFEQGRQLLFFCFGNKIVCHNMLCICVQGKRENVMWDGSINDGNGDRRLSKYLPGRELLFFLNFFFPHGWKLTSPPLNVIIFKFLFQYVI